MAGSIDGLVSGMDTTTVVAQLMQLERMPQTRMRTQQSTLQTLLNAYRSLNTNVSSLRDAAAKITAVKSWEPAKATSSSTAHVGVTASLGAAVGSFTFTVKALAAGATGVLSGSVATAETGVAAGPVLVAKGAQSLGFSSIDQGAVLAAGAHVLTVAQSSSAATKTGTTPLAGTTTIGLGNAALALELDGVPTMLTLTAGVYTPATLAAEVTRASAGALTASVTDNGTLSLSTTAEGSGATLRAVTGHTDLGLTADVIAATGGNGKIRLGSDPTSDLVVTRVAAGQTLIASDLAGNSVSVTAAGGLRSGEAALTNVAVTAGATLAEVTLALNSAKAGVTATAVEVSPGINRLQLSSTTTGVASELMLDADSLATLGSLQSLSAGRDALLTVGSGPASYDVTRASNTITGLLPGVTLNLVKADPLTAVTIDVQRDAEAVASRVTDLVAALNSVLTQTKSLTSYDTEKKKGSMLMGDGMIRRLSSDVVRAATGATTEGVLNIPSGVGISVDRAGALTFDKAKFLEAYAADPAAVEALVGLGTEASPGIAGRVEALATRLTRAGDGLLPSSIRSRENEIKGLGDRITGWDSRLTMREATLKRQFSAMETALGKMQSQSNWLSGQLAQLS